MLLTCMPPPPLFAEILPVVILLGTFNLELADFAVCSFFTPSLAHLSNRASHQREIHQLLPFSQDVPSFGHH